MEYLYYPGCSLKGQAKFYETSLFGCFEKLDISLTELPDWNCCGATSYMSVDMNAALAMAARNIAIAEDLEQDIIAPCSACYMVLNKVQHQLTEYPQVGDKIRKALAHAGLRLHGKRIRIRHPLDVLVNDIKLEFIRERLHRKLAGMRLFPYYGCQVVRPRIEPFDAPWHPVSMDRLFAFLEADVVDHSLKTRCCGGSLTGTIEEVGLKLVYILLKEAKKKGAQVIATLCPLCQFNLEAYQPKVEKTFRETLKMPILYFTQLLGFALGVDESLLGLNKLIVPADELFAHAGQGGPHEA